MNTPDRHTLDEYFANARIEPPVTTDEDIFSMLDEEPTPGQPTLRTGTYNNAISRGRIMKIIAATIITASLGTTLLYFNTQQTPQVALPVLTQKATAQITTPQKNVDAAPTIMAKQPAASFAVPLPRKATIHRQSPNRLVSRSVVIHNDDNGDPKSTTTVTVNGTDYMIDTAVARQFGEEMSQLAASYWVEKINAYRVSIDRMLATDDLSNLRQMRVRWGIAMADTSANNGLISSMGLGGNAPDDNDMKGKRKFEISMNVKKEGNSDPNVDAKVKFNGQEVNMGGAMEMMLNMMAASGDERAKIIISVKEMGNRYRPGLDALRETIFADVAGFMTTVSGRVESFAAAYKNNEGSANTLTTPEGSAETVTKKIEEMRKGFGSDQVQRMLGSIYNFIGEPLLMLYNGSDIGGLVPASIAAPVPGMKIVANETLRQSFPNPASSNVTLSYKLAEPSSATVLRIYDATGKVVATYDRGAQPAGEHNVSADVSQLLPGTYLYHLTTQTSSGEQVFSKTLNVVR